MATYLVKESGTVFTIREQADFVGFDADGIAIPADSPIGGKIMSQEQMRTLSGATIAEISALWNSL